MSDRSGGERTDVLHYLPEAQRTRSSAIAIYTLMAPLFAGMAVAAFGYGEVALPTIFVTALAMYLYRRHDRSTPYITLQVTSGVLHLKGRGHPGATIRLEDLHDVSLDSKSVERVQEAGPMPELRFINSTVAPAVDESRIELETRDGSVFLTEHRVSNLDASEWSNKIRRFLRKNGWVPEDERPES
ncbi:MAG TPA: hypothetical protein VFZ53_06915 [Polyangiaceae bacterium]